MSFGVRKLPDSNDPRTNTFCCRGYAWGMVPPYKWRLTCAGAAAPVAEFVTGVVIEPYVTTLDLYHCERFFGYPPFVRCRIWVRGFEEVQSGPGLWTVTTEIEVLAGAIDIYAGNRFDLWPQAIRQFTVPCLPSDPGSPDLFPGGITFTPVIWDTPDSP